LRDWNRIICVAADRFLLKEEDALATDHGSGSEETAG